MAKFLRQSERVQIKKYSLCWDLYGPGWGYSFPCDEYGQVFVEQLKDLALDNYQMCLESDVKPCWRNESYSYIEPAVIECDVCDGEVVLDGFTNTCDTCDEQGVVTDYNLSGQRLAPRSQWGEETGETYADIVGGEENY